MDTRHEVSEVFIRRFQVEYAEIFARISRVVEENETKEEQKNLERILKFFRRSESALVRHRYRVVEWRETIEKMLFVYKNSPKITSCLRDLSSLLSAVLTETKGMN